MDFTYRLKHDLNIEPSYYINKAKSQAKKYNLNYKTIQFSNAKNKKLSIRDNDNKLVNFGSSINNDFIIWKMLEQRGVVERGYSSMKQNVFHKSHEAMNYNKNNPYSANNLSLWILW